MKKLMFFAVFCITACGMVTLFSCSSQVPQAKLKTDIDSLSYAYGIRYTQGLDEYLQQKGFEKALKDEFYKGFMEGAKIDRKDKMANARLEGMAIGRQVASDMFFNTNQSVFGSDSTHSLNKSQYLAGFLAAAQNKKLLMKPEEVQMFIDAKSAIIQAKVNEPIKKENQTYLDDNGKKPGIISLPSGLQYKVEKEGVGIKPGVEDTVIVKFLGKDIHEKEFEKDDSTKFVLNGVIKGWSEGIQLMSPGAKYTFYIPYTLGYGEQGRQPKIGPYATLVFDVELLKVLPKSATASTPNVAPRVQIAPKK